MLELHSNWNLPSALRIAQATKMPILLSERMAGPFQFEELLESGVARYVSFDLTWCGGLTVARKVA